MGGTLARLIRCGLFSLPGLLSQLLLGGAATMLGAAASARCRPGPADTAAAPGPAPLATAREAGSEG